MEPKDARVRSNLASYLRLAGDAGGALEQIQEATRLAPAKALYHRELGKVFATQKDYAAAAAAFRAAVERDPKDFSSQFNLGWALLHLDRPAEAIEPLQEAIRLKP
ncbi:MAG: tetratricopeptide repeat protein, partial [Thermoleophilia bacterium]|nr:tetratricopeptide repeat protein [Thermoleophilia bacterium]